MQPDPGGTGLMEPGKLRIVGRDAVQQVNEPAGHFRIGLTELHRQRVALDFKRLVVGQPFRQSLRLDRLLVPPPQAWQWADETVFDRLTRDVYRDLGGRAQLTAVQLALVEAFVSATLTLDNLDRFVDSR